MYSLYNFKSRGTGVISTEVIPSNKLIGFYFTKNELVTSESRPIYDGWIETNPLGRYLNHNENPNLTLIKNENVIELYSNQIIPKHTELTVDYLNVVKLINLPESLILSYEIFNFDYIDEEIVVNKSII